MTPEEITLTPAGTNRWTAELQHSFDHPHWLGFLGGGLARLQVSIVSGWARRDGAGHWSAEFDLDFSLASVAAGALDLVEMATLRPIRDSTPPRVSTWSLDRRADGLITLDISAVDQIGFLGRLLGRLAVLGLLPMEVELATVAGVVSDRLVLSRVGGLAPAADVDDALDSLLRTLSRGVVLAG